MLYQHDIVAGQQIANPFPANQVGMVIGRLQYRARQGGYVPYVEIVASTSLPPVSTKKQKGFLSEKANS